MRLMVGMEKRLEAITVGDPVYALEGQAGSLSERDLRCFSGIVPSCVPYWIRMSPSAEIESGRKLARSGHETFPVKLEFCVRKYLEQRVRRESVFRL